MDRVMALRMQVGSLPNLVHRYTFVLFGNAILVVAQKQEDDGGWNQGLVFLNWSVDADLAGQELTKMVNARERLGADLLGPPVVVDFDELPEDEGMLGLFPHEIEGWWSSLEELARKEQLPPNDGGVYDIAGDFLLRNGKPV